jgi:3'(2'), 5'-bisphosphate nucleotidase
MQPLFDTRLHLYLCFMTDHDLLELCFSLAAEAGDAILAVRARGFETSVKADFSPVTEADHAAELIIAAGLRAATPDIPVVAEEEMAGGHVPREARAFWLVDPLDGTKEFAAGRDDFAVCIGLVRDGRPVLGVVGGPAYGTLYGGIVGEGAVLRDGAGERAISVRSAPEAGLTVIASRSSASHPRVAPYLAGHSVAETIQMGSALKFCRVAEGVADLYPRFGRTMEWDTAAAQAVLEAAGGAVRDADTGAKLGYGKPGFENPHFVALGTS